VLRLFRYTLSIFFILLFVSSYGQKVKYKDLFPLLDAKRYEEAEPFLKTFLIQDADHANANLQMGFVLESKTKKEDVFKGKESIQVSADSAIIFFNKFNTLLNEKEIKKRESYYQEYNRRDLRTGKFGIKEQDIRYDIEERIKNLNDYKSKVKDLNGYMSDAVRQYHTAKSSFIYLSRSEQTMDDFLLTASLVTEESLEYMTQSYDSSLQSIKNAQRVLEEIGNDIFMQSVDYQEIEDYKSDGYSDADFYSESFTLWEYKNWSNQIIDKINNEIKPLRQDILDYSKKLNDLFVVAEPDLTLLNSLGGMNFKEKLLSFDEDPLPLRVFDYKKMEILYKIESNPNINPLLGDSTHVDNLLQSASNNVQILKEADTLINLFGDNEVLKHEVKKHHDFAEQEFTNLESLENFISFKRDWLKQEIPKWENTYDSLFEISKYAFLDSDTLLIDVIPDSSYYLIKKVNYEEPELLTLSKILNDSLNYFLGGLKLNGSVNNYFISKIAPSRKSVWYFEESVTPFFDKDTGDSLTVSMNEISNGMNDLWMLISLRTDAVMKGNLIKMDQHGGKEWEAKMILGEGLEGLSLDSDSNQVTITLSDGSSLVFDKDGKAVN